MPVSNVSREDGDGRKKRFAKDFFSIRQLFSAGRQQRKQQQRRWSNSSETVEQEDLARDNHRRKLHHKSVDQLQQHNGTKLEKKNFLAKLFQKKSKKLNQEEPRREWPTTTSEATRIAKNNPDISQHDESGVTNEEINKIVARCETGDAEEDTGNDNDIMHGDINVGGCEGLQRNSAPRHDQFYISLDDGKDTEVRDNNNTSNGDSELDQRNSRGTENLPSTDEFESERGVKIRPSRFDLTFKDNEAAVSSEPEATPTSTREATSHDTQCPNDDEIRQLIAAKKKIRNQRDNKPVSYFYDICSDDEFSACHPSPDIHDINFNDSSAGDRSEDKGNASFSIRHSRADLIQARAESRNDSESGANPSRRVIHAVGDSNFPNLPDILESATVLNEANATDHPSADQSLTSTFDGSGYNQPRVDGKQSTSVSDVVTDLNYNQKIPKYSTDIYPRHSESFVEENKARCVISPINNTDERFSSLPNLVVPSLGNTLKIQSLDKTTDMALVRKKLFGAEREARQAIPPRDKLRLHKSLSDTPTKVEYKFNSLPRSSKSAYARNCNRTLAQLTGASKYLSRRQLDICLPPSSPDRQLRDLKSASLDRLDGRRHQADHRRNHRDPKQLLYTDRFHRYSTVPADDATEARPIPRTAMAKFNADGTPRSILKKRSC